MVKIFIRLGRTFFCAVIRNRERSKIISFIILLMLFSLLGSSYRTATDNSEHHTASNTPPSLPMSVEISHFSLPIFNSYFIVNLKVIQNYYSDTLVILEIPDAFYVVKGDIEWRGHINRDEPKQFRLALKAMKTGKYLIKASAYSMGNNDSVAMSTYGFLYIYIHEKPSIVSKAPPIFQNILRYLSIEIKPAKVIEIERHRKPPPSEKMIPFIHTGPIDTLFPNMVRPMKSSKIIMPNYYVIASSNWKTYFAEPPSMLTGAIFIGVSKEKNNPGSDIMISFISFKDYNVDNTVEIGIESISTRAGLDEKWKYSVAMIPKSNMTVWGNVIFMFIDAIEYTELTRIQVQIEK